MIEIVLDANTTANINKDDGGAVSVFYKDTLSQWLKKRNPSSRFLVESFSSSSYIIIHLTILLPEAEYAQAQETFLYSCAGCA